MSTTGHAPSDALTVHARLSHSDLLYADHPLVVGHYRRDVIVNAEAVLDAALDQALRHRFDLGVYPGEIGSSLIIRNRVRPKGAIVVGLGNVGDLTAQQLRQTFAIALRQYALSIAEDPAVPLVIGQQYRSAAFSTLLVGTDGNGVGTLADSISAIVRAALDANRSLRHAKLFDRVRIDEIEFVELYEDVASRAAHVIAELPTLLSREIQTGERLTAANEVTTRTGSRFLRPASPYEAGWWQRIAVQEKKPEADGSAPVSDAATQLKFTVLTDRARLEQDVTTAQRTLVQELVNSATSQSAYDPELSAALYRLLVPVPVQERIAQGGDVVFMLDRVGASFPFELMATRAADGRIRALVEDRGILRQFETDRYQVRPEMARSNAIFVVGNPQTLLWDSLPQAELEAEAVEAVAAKNHLAVSRPPRDDPNRIVSTLMSGEYRILHFATHGQYHPDPLRSGVVISDRLLITPAEITRMPLVPELVFLNCCYLGKMTDSSRPASPDPRLASSLAEGFIRAGVRAVIAAGWAVNDHAARTFATTFYEELLNGARFGDSVRSARRKAADDHAASNTWGAYQCYGNPDYRFIQSEVQRGSTKTRFVSPSEALQGLRTLASRARSMGPRDSRDSLSAELDRLLENVPQEWRKRGDVLAVCGEVAGELEDFGRAIEFYRHAIGKDPANAPLIAVEQLANLLSRSGASRMLSGGARYQDVEDSFCEAESWLEWLEKVGGTTERTALRGSLYKRWAICLAAKRREFLRKSELAYTKLVDEEQKDYQWLNALAARFVLAPPKRRKELGKHVDERWEAIRGGMRSDVDFWDVIAAADTYLHKLVVNSTLDEAARKELETLYGRAKRAKPSPRQWASVTDHIWFLRTMTGDDKLPCHDADLSATLEKLRLSLAAEGSYSHDAESA